MIVVGVRCKLCGDVAYSRANHDLRHCGCRACGIDGGRGDRSLHGEPDNYDVVVFELDVFENELEEDWNYGRGKYGRIQKEEVEKMTFFIKEEKEK